MSGIKNYYDLMNSTKVVSKLSKFIDLPKKKGKAVVMCDKDTGKEIRVFNSAYRASEILGVNNTNIYRCLIGKIGSAYGYKWKYL